MEPISTKSNQFPLADLAGYEILVCVTGGIAAYKTASVVSALTQRGASVSVAMTRAATELVGPMTFQALSGRAVLTSMWKPVGDAGVRHIQITEAADLLLVAPATANTIGKIAGGIADDFVSTLVVSAASPVVLAPAMNERMWANPIVASNVDRLKELGYIFVGPEEGWLACGDVGPGRMVEPERLVETVASLLAKQPPKCQPTKANKS